MAETIRPMVVDLSHWDPANDYAAVKRDGIVGVIYKATEGQSYTDDTYPGQQQAAKRAGLKWGSYHFADASNVAGQIDNYLRYAAPDPDELFSLDWEDNPSGGGRMSKDNAIAWITEVENALDRPGECVIYSGNTAKELLGDTKSAFFGSRRLWLAQYGPTPTWQKSWETYWLWQFCDGINGPEPHSIDGIGPCDINSFPFSAERLRAEWASGANDVRPVPPEPGAGVVAIAMTVPEGIAVEISINGVPLLVED